MAFVPYKSTTALLTNNAYGNYGGRPRGAVRRVPAKLLLCIHITDGDETTANIHTHATNERNYANRAGSVGPSAHDYVNQDGSVMHAIDPAKFAAWSNGDLQSPNKALPLVQTVLAEVAKGYNPNEVYYREIECCGNRGRDLPITSAQLETAAQMVARDSITTGIPISRKTVGTHADINTVTRAGCAFAPSTREAKMSALISRAQAIKLEMALPPAPPPATYTQAQLDAAVAAATLAGARDAWDDCNGGAIVDWDEGERVARIVLPPRP